MAEKCSNGLRATSRSSAAAPGERRWRSPARAPGAPCRCGSTTPPMRPISQDTAREPVSARRAARRPHRLVADLAEAARAAGHSSGRAGAGGARGHESAVATAGGRHAGDRLRQGHRARHPEIHDRSRRRMRAQARRPAILSGPSFAADVARGLPTAVTLAARDEALAAALAAGDRLGDLAALSFDRRARRRDRRRRQERARHRGRRRRRPRARRQRGRGADHPRLRRARALRQGLRREAGNA